MNPPSRWLFACACLLVSGVAIAQASTPAPPVAVPDVSEFIANESNLAAKHALDRRHDALAQSYAAWQRQAEQFNRQYVGQQFDADSPQARDGEAAQARVADMANRYVPAAAQFRTDVDAFLASASTDDDDLRVVSDMKALAKRSGWSQAEQASLGRALDRLSNAHESGQQTDAATVRDTWTAIRDRADLDELAAEASSGAGPGVPGAGLQTDLDDCAVFSLANATGRPYGVVSAYAAELIGKGEWRNAEERAHPEHTIEQGLNGGEVVMLAETFGNASVVPGTAFAKTLQDGHPIMVNVRPPSGGDGGHEVVLTKSFQHANQTWYEMMDSYQGPVHRLYLSADQLQRILKEPGVVYRPGKGTTPQLLR